MMRPKSWLLAFADANKVIHFYDCKDGPVKALNRIHTAQSQHELLEIIPFLNPTGAEEMAGKIRDVRKLVSYLQDKVSPTLASPPSTAADSQ